MIRINLLTEARAAAAKKKGPALPTGAKLNNLLLIGGLALGLIYIGTMFLVLHNRNRKLDTEIAQAKEEVARLKSIIDEVKGYEDKKRSLEEKIDLINNLKTNQKGPVRLMDEVSKALPDLVWLTDMTMQGDQLTMKGRTLSPNAVATYLENLKKSPYFAEPVFKNLGREPGPQGIYAWEMAVKFTYGTSGGRGQQPRRRRNRPAAGAEAGGIGHGYVRHQRRRTPLVLRPGGRDLRRGPARRAPSTGSCFKPKQEEIAAKKVELEGLKQEIAEGPRRRAQARPVPRRGQAARARARQAPPDPALQAQHRRAHQADRDAHPAGRLHAAQVHARRVHPEGVLRGVADRHPDSRGRTTTSRCSSTG